MRTIRLAPRGPFALSLGFAALAAGALPLWLLFSRPMLGADRAVGAYFVLAAAAYLGTIAPSRSRALAAAVLAAVAGGAATLITRAPAELALVLGSLVAVVRSGFLYRCTPARGVVVETIVTGGGLAFAHFLFGPTLAALVLALWGFFLVQGLYFLLGARRAPVLTRHPDAFQDAHARAIALLDRGEGLRLT